MMIAIWSPMHLAYMTMFGDTPTDIRGTMFFGNAKELKDHCNYYGLDTVKAGRGKYKIVVNN